MILGFIIIFITVLLDQVLKVLAKIYLTDQIDIIPGFLSLDFTTNTGAGFGMFDNQFAFLMIATSVATIVFAYFFSKIKFKKAPFYSIGISLMIGGMLGNFIDRVVRGWVIDFIRTDFGDYMFPIFNIADSALTIGVILFGIDLIFLYDKRNN